MELREFKSALAQAITNNSSIEGEADDSLLFTGVEKVEETDDIIVSFQNGKKVALRVAKDDQPIYTHDEAARLVELFEDVLSRYDIHVPSPEDDEREEDNEVGLYGSTYSDLLDEVEERLIELLEGSRSIVKYEYSGSM